MYENNIITAVRNFWNSYFISIASIFPVSTIPVSGYGDFSAPREGWASQINLGKCGNVKNSWLTFGYYELYSSMNNFDIESRCLYLL